MNMLLAILGTIFSHPIMAFDWTSGLSKPSRSSRTPPWTRSMLLYRNGRPWQLGGNARRMFTILGFGAVEVASQNAAGQLFLKGDPFGTDARLATHYVFGFFHFVPRRADHG